MIYQCRGCGMALSKDEFDYGHGLCDSCGEEHDKQVAEFRKTVREKLTTPPEGGYTD